LRRQRRQARDRSVVFETAYEAVALARQRLDVAVGVRIVFQGDAELAHGAVEAGIKFHHTLWPEPRDELLTRDHLARVLGELVEDLQRLVLQTIGIAVAGDFSRIEVYRPAIELYDALPHAPSDSLD
jgi:hypothetical protein